MGKCACAGYTCAQTLVLMSFARIALQKLLRSCFEVDSLISPEWKLSSAFEKKHQREIHSDGGEINKQPKKSDLSIEFCR